MAAEFLLDSPTDQIDFAIRSNEPAEEFHHFTGIIDAVTAEGHDYWQELFIH